MKNPNPKVQLEQYLKQLELLKNEMNKSIIGQESTLDLILISLLAGGHCLLEGVPGLGKTRMLKALGYCLDLNFSRIQFTPDLMPSDIIGSELIDETSNQGGIRLKFVPGPVFTQLLLADEINRTPPKTQAALLEVMGELTVTVAGSSYNLEPPFMVLATQNPIEQSGTYSLPEAQLDRFLMRIELGYPERQQEIAIINDDELTDPEQLQNCLNTSDLLNLKALVDQIVVGPSLRTYIIDLARLTRPETSTLQSVKEGIKWGVSPRACQALVKAAKARAMMNHRLAVLPEDIHSLLKPVWSHRMVGTLGAFSDQSITSEILEDIVNHHPLPGN